MAPLGRRNYRVDTFDLAQPSDQLIGQLERIDEQDRHRLSDAAQDQVDLGVESVRDRPLQVGEQVQHRRGVHLGEQVLVVTETVLLQVVHVSCQQRRRMPLPIQFNSIQFNSVQFNSFILAYPKYQHRFNQLNPCACARPFVRYYTCILLALLAIKI